MVDETRSRMTRSEAEVWREAANQAERGEVATAGWRANVRGANQEASDFITLGRQLQQVGQGVQNTWDQFGATIASQIPSKMREAYDKIQYQFGGLGDDILSPTNNMARVMQSTTRDVYSEMNRTSEMYEIHQMSLKAVFKDVGEAMEYFNEMAEEQAGNYALLSSANANLAIEMQLFGEGIGLESKQTGDFIRRQISLTGEAGTDMLREAVVYANKVADYTGDSAKLIAQNMSAMISDTENFGNVTVVESARISSELRQIGIAYGDLSGMVGQFRGFEQASQSVSALTTVFGVQLDAMELMRLANEDQGGFLRRIRQDFLQTGKSVDQLSLAEKRLIKEQLNLKDVASVERLLDPRTAITSFEELSMATSGVATDTGAAMDEIQDDIQVMSNAAEMRADAMRDHMQEAFREGVIDSTFQAEQQFIRFGHQAVEALTDSTEKSDALTIAMEDLAQGPLSMETAGGLMDWINTLNTDVRTAGAKVYETTTAIVNGVEVEWTRFSGAPWMAIVERMTEGLTTGFSNAFGEIENDYLKISTRPPRGWERRSMSPAGREVFEGFKLAFDALPPALQESFGEMENINAESMNVMLGQSDSALTRMVQDVARTYEQTYDELNEDDKIALRQRLHLGEDYEAQIRSLMSSSAWTQGKDMQALEDSAGSFLADMKMMKETFNSADLRRIQEQFGLDPELVQEYMGAESTASLADIAGERLRAASRARVVGEDEEAAEEESEDGTPARHRGRAPRHAGGPTSSSRSLDELKEVLEKVETNTDPDNNSVQVIVNLDSVALIDQIVRGTGTGGVQVSHSTPGSTV